MGEPQCKTCREYSAQHFLQHLRTVINYKLVMFGASSGILDCIRQLPGHVGNEVSSTFAAYGSNHPTKIQTCPKVFCGCIRYARNSWNTLNTHTLASFCSAAYQKAGDLAIPGVTPFFGGGTSCASKSSGSMLKCSKDPIPCCSLESKTSQHGSR